MSRGKSGGMELTSVLDLSKTILNCTCHGLQLFAAMLPSPPPPLHHL
jgi:hypothetical protein